MKIRFRVGHSWKREAPGPAGPRDAFTFELDGVNLVPGATDEPLVHVVSGLLDAVAGLVVDGEPAGELSLEDVALELCFWRRPGLEVEVAIVDLAGGGLKRGRPVVVELPALLEAAVQCGRALARDLSSQERTAEALAIEKKLSVLAGALIEPAPERPTQAFVAQRSAAGGLGYHFDDAEGRAQRWARRSRAGLSCLLASGTIQAAGGEVEPGHPVLRLMALARAASDGAQRVGGVSVAPEAIFAAGLELCLSLRAHNPALSSNPWLEALQLRCADGLKALRQPLPDLSPTVLPAGRTSTGDVPLSTQGSVRRVGVSHSWTRPVALGEESGRVTLGKGLVVVHSPHAAHAFDPKGATKFRRMAPRGVAVAATGESVLATSEQVLHFPRAGRSATWVRDHDGVTLGPTLTPVGGVLVTPLGRHGASGLDALTGRERWRFDPPRTQKSWVSCLGSRVFVGTDSGSLYALDAVEGHVRFRVKASLPCAGPSVLFGQVVVTALNRGEHTAIFSCTPAARGDATPAGTIRWTRELVLSTPSRVSVARGKLFVAGAREGRTWVVCLGSRGQVLWERSVPCDARTVTLSPFEGGVLSADARGVCTRLRPDGQVDWVLGGFDDELSQEIPLQQARHVLVVPGPTVRLVHPQDGRVLGELDTGPRLSDLAVDKKLNIYAFSEPGTLTAWAPGRVLSVV
ncbi:MAG: PQQ-binding-like beta-propeller repeat protein [Myxococcota bacterium]